MYAILSHGGRQYRVSAGDRLLVDRLDVDVGSVIALEPVLLTGGDGKTGLGKDLDGMRVAVTVLAHRRGRKLRIFKYKAKKRSRKVAGYRSDLTELRVESILAKAATLPQATATVAGGAAETSAAPDEPVRVARRRPPTATAKAGAAPVVGADATATEEERATAPTPVRRRAAKSASAPDASPAAGSALPAGDSGVEESGFSDSTTAKPKLAGGTTKTAAPKTSKRGAAAKDEETGDGA
jgi:large subunit ribosomal protein L21